MASRRLAIVATGGREYGRTRRGDTKARIAEAERESAHVVAALERLKPDVVLHGGATGADAIVDAWCQLNSVKVIAYPAQWDKYPKAAGPMRNGTMCDDLMLYKNDGYRIGVVAFPGGAGTASCVNHAERRGIKVWTPATEEVAPARSNAA